MPKLDEDQMYISYDKSQWLRALFLSFYIGQCVAQEGEVTSSCFILPHLCRDGGWGNFDGNSATLGTSYTHVDNDK